MVKGQRVGGPVCPRGHLKAEVGAKFDGECRQCIRNRDSARPRRTGAARSATTRKHELKRAYGMTVEQYDNLLESQHGGCAICSLSCKTGNRLAVDHDHKTGKVRGLLCGNCNQALGRLNDNTALLERAIGYLERST